MTEYHMWTYWRDKKGYERAVREYFPIDLSNNQEVTQAVAMINAGKRILDSIFRELAGKEEEDEHLD